MSLQGWTPSCAQYWGVTWPLILYLGFSLADIRKCVFYSLLLVLLMHTIQCQPGGLEYDFLSYVLSVVYSFLRKRFFASVHLK